MKGVALSLEVCSLQMSIRLSLQVSCIRMGMLCSKLKEGLSYDLMDGIKEGLSLDEQSGTAFAQPSQCSDHFDLRTESLPQGHLLATFFAGEDGGGVCLTSGGAVGG